MNYKEASFTASSTAELQFELTLDETASVVMATTTNLATSVVSGQAMLVNTLALPQVLSTSSDGALINSVIELESSGDNNEKLAWLMSSIDHWREGQNLTTYYVNKFLLVARSLQKQEELINGKITALKETMETIKKNQYLSNIEKQQLIAQAQDLINYNLVLLKYYARLNLNQLQEYLNTAVNRRKINTADYVIIRASLDQIRLFYEKRA